MYYKERLEKGVLGFAPIKNTPKTKSRNLATYIRFGIYKNKQTIIRDKNIIKSLKSILLKCVFFIYFIYFLLKKRVFELAKVAGLNDPL